MRLRGEAGNEVTQQQRNVEEMLERAARTEQRDAAQELADKTQARPNVAQTPRRMMALMTSTERMIPRSISQPSKLSAVDCEKPTSSIRSCNQRSICGDEMSIV